MNLEWERVEPTEVVKVGEYRTMVRKNFRLPDGRIAEYVTKEKEGTVSGAIIALTRDNKVVLAKQFRVGPEKVMYELPGGGIAPGEDPEHGVLRELEEETGYKAGRVERLGKVYKDGYNNAVWEYFIAYDCEPTEGGQKLDDTEFIEVALVSVAELLAHARSASMTDTEALFLAYDKLKELEG
jgi:ADP-ribose pyrophosphatase